MSLLSKLELSIWADWKGWILYVFGPLCHQSVESGVELGSEVPCRNLLTRSSSVTSHCPAIRRAVPSHSSQLLWIEMEWSINICYYGLMWKSLFYQQCWRGSKIVGAVGDCCATLPPVGDTSGLWTGTLVTLVPHPSHLLKTMHKTGSMGTILRDIWNKHDC